MIKSKHDLKHYIECDKKARWGDSAGYGIKLKTKKLMKFNILLRKAEYHVNNHHKILSAVYKYRLNNLGMKLGWSVEPNVFGPGMCIVHYGTVVVNPNARIGKNARIHAGVKIGASGGRKKAPVIGDNVYFGPGAKIFGDIKIGSNIAIGANAVVNKSFEEDGVTLGGIPAKIISRKGYYPNKSEEQV